MKKLLLIGLALTVSLAIVVPASAFVFVFGTVEKEKEVTVIETIIIDKNVTIAADVDVSPASAAEAIALANQEVLFGTVTGSTQDIANGGEPLDGIQDVQLNAVIRNSIGAGSDSGNTGIVSVNQDVGNMAGQGNNLAIAVTDVPGAFVNAESSASQINAFNSVWVEEDACNLVQCDDQGDPIQPITPDSFLPPQKESLITGSINYNTGIVSVNQNAGNMNLQLNNLALAANVSVALDPFGVTGAGAAVALSEADLGQINGANTVNEVNTHKADRIVASMNNNIGIVNVNQSSGNMNNQANILSLAVGP